MCFSDLLPCGVYIQCFTSQGIIISRYEGTVSASWKCAEVIPIAKTVKPTSVDSDLRPISLTTILSKVLEDFVYGWLRPIAMPQIDTRLIHEWLQAAETPKTIIRSCLMDFSKAFDHIDQCIVV